MPTVPARPRVVIIGGGFGGLSAAKALRGKDLDVLLIDSRNHHVFQPLLYQVATAGLSPGDIASPIRWILRGQQNVRVWLAEARAIDASRRVVRLADGEVSYDYLIVAAGAGHSYFGHDEWRQYAPGLKTLEDALDIRRRVLLAFEQAERAASPAEQRRLLTLVAGPRESSWRARSLRSPVTLWHMTSVRSTRRRLESSSSKPDPMCCRRIPPICRCRHEGNWNDWAWRSGRAVR